jgi:hypothetical protein
MRFKADLIEFVRSVLVTAVGAGGKDEPDASVDFVGVSSVVEYGNDFTSQASFRGGVGGPPAPHQIHYQNGDDSDENCQGKELAGGEKPGSEHIASVNSYHAVGQGVEHHPR